MAGFAETVALVKRRIDEAKTNRDVRNVLTPILEHSIALSNRVLGWTKSTGFFNPLTLFKEVWSPKNDQLIEEWKQVNSAIAVFEQYLSTIPNDDEAFILSKKMPKDEAVRLLSAVQTIGQFTISKEMSGQWNDAFASFLYDVEHAPGLFLKYTGKAVEATMDHVVTPIAKPTGVGLYELLKSIAKSMWWVILLAIAVILILIYVPIITGRILDAIGLSAAAKVVSGAA